ncbi:MAG: AgmX/PglI C-terminal domain-containing protein [Deltaproteobacteria bacterium]|nr:AgmX/PglI C-terminal domain-containing protein [Deltaproteobacteria bacterium]
MEIDGVTHRPEGWRHSLVGWLGGWIAGSSPYVAASALAHVALLAFVAYSTPALGAIGDDDLDHERRARLFHHVSSLAQPELESGPARIDWVARSGGTGQRAVGREGTMGDPSAAATGPSGANRWRGRDTMPRLPTSAPGTGTDSGACFLAAGLLLSRDGIGATEPNAVWGMPGGQGNGLEGANGSLWGGPIGSAAGAGGLGLSGVGEGGGGRGFGIGLGQVGTIGRGAGTGRGAGLGRSHQARPPRVRCGYLLETYSELEASAALAERDDAELTCTAWSAEEPGQCTSWQVSGDCAVSVSGRLPPERVQQVMRQNHGRFRLCYQRGLRTNPALQGRIVARFVIGRDGTVSGATAQGDLPDPQVKACVASAVSTLQFPRPAGGVVAITYPLVLTRAD